MRNKITSAILEHKIIVIVRGVPKDKLIPMAEAMYKGGIRLLELAYSPDGSEAHEDTAANIRMLSNHFQDKLLIGAGTVLKPEQVRLTKNAGGRFIISPDVSKDVIEETVSQGLVSIPGGLTPTEIQAAHKWGADFVKVFPVNCLGLDYVKLIHTPLKHVNLLAVGGIGLDDVKAYLDAGVKGFAIGSAIANKALLEKNDYAGITAVSQAFVEAVK